MTKHLWVGLMGVMMGLLFAAAGCGGAPSEQTPCTPGTSVACVGPGGCNGGQVCQADGKGFLTCDCSIVPTEDGGVDPDGGTPSDDAQTQPDATDAGKPDGPCVPKCPPGLCGPNIADGCGGKIYCPGTPKTCAQLGAECGNPSDGCGGLLTCTGTYGNSICNDNNLCTTDVCNGSYKCQHTNTSGNACAGGVCGNGNGVCCTGCFLGNTCQPGNTVNACGNNGNACNVGCSDNNPCTTDNCNGQGQCTHTNVANGSQPIGCQNANQACTNGVCGACGGQNQVCCGQSQTCGQFLQCSGSTCVCGGLNQWACNGTTCNNGLVLCSNAADINNYHKCLSSPCA